MALAVPSVMPHLLSFAEDSDIRNGVGMEPGKTQSDKKRAQKQYHSMWDRLSLHKWGNWLKKEENGEPPPDGQDEGHFSDKLEKSRFLGRRGSRKVVPGLPRPITFRRQNSERRDNLCPNDVDADDRRRALSADRRGGFGGKRSLSPPPMNTSSISAPDVFTPMGVEMTNEPFDTEERGATNYGQPEDIELTNSIPDFCPREPLPLLTTTGELTDHGSVSDGIDDHVLQQELEAKWILNLSMHFRDLSDREKFFITYAEEPTKWRRVTVSCDYRDVPPDSLEADLKSLHYQRDKSARIYESIRDSLLDIQFYPTVTNLKLQTDDGRLHVHVTEDVNEIIPYPPVSAVSHLPGHRFRESDVGFDSHISGFVYKVAVGNQVFIKKEIPGPDTVEEFLYEVNALCSLQDFKSVIKYEGLVVDDSGELIKGVLISFAEQGALVDLIFDLKGKIPWERREIWAKQIVEGLSEIHEAGFVQGDFTVSNIVIDANDNAKIIDINRRGCPVGWEPPELVRLIENGQRISMYIGVKSDLFQLGMVLWALAVEQDEPERQERPLGWDGVGSEVPQYFKNMVDACLSDDPRKRLSAKELLATFPASIPETDSRPSITSRHSLSTHRSDKEYIDPATAVDLADIERSRQDHIGDPSRPSSISAEDLGFAEAGASSSYKFSSSGSFVVPRRGRPRACVSAHGSTSVSASASRGRRSFNYSPSPAARISSVSLDDSDLEAAFIHEHDPIAREPRWEEVYVDGDTRLVQRSSNGIGTHNFAKEAETIECLPPAPPSILTSNDLVALSPNSSSPIKQSESISTDTLTLGQDASPKKHKGKEVSLDDEPVLQEDFTPFMLQPCRASFHDRVQQRRSHDSTLADLEEEILNPSSQAPGYPEYGVENESEMAPLHIEPLKHYDSGFHEPGSNALGSMSRSTTFGPPIHVDSGFQASAIRALGSSSKVNSFGPPLHSDSGFEEKNIASSSLGPFEAIDFQEEMSASIAERSREDEIRVREAVRKILSGELNSKEKAPASSAN